MARYFAYTGAVLVVVSLLFASTGVSQLAPPSPSGATPPIGTTVVVFGDDQVTPNRFAVRAFVRTGSLSNHCLATLSESSFAVPGISVFCGPREFEGQKGVLFSAFFPETVPEGFTLSATLYQEQAREYAAPVFFCGAGVDC